jgi:hypothetical protein
MDDLLKSTALNHSANPASGLQWMRKSVREIRIILGQCPKNAKYEVSIL